MLLEKEEYLYSAIYNFVNMFYWQRNGQIITL